MKNIIVQCIVAVICVLFLSSCGGGSVGAKAGKEVCDCLAQVKKSSGDAGDLASGFAAFGCLMGISEKYKEHFGDDNFKNPQDQKDFEAALKKCAPEFLEQMNP